MSRAIATHRPTQSSSRWAGERESIAAAVKAAQAEEADTEDEATSAVASAATLEGELTDAELSARIPRR